MYVPLLLLKYVGRGESAECDCYHAEEKERERRSTKDHDKGSRNIHRRFQTIKVWGNCQFVFKLALAALQSTPKVFYKERRESKLSGGNFCLTFPGHCFVSTARCDADQALVMSARPPSVHAAQYSDYRAESCSSRYVCPPYSCVCVTEEGKLLRSLAEKCPWARDGRGFTYGIKQSKDKRVI